MAEVARRMTLPDVSRRVRVDKIGLHWVELMLEIGLHEARGVIDRTVSDVCGRERTVLTKVGGGGRFWRQAAYGEGLTVKSENVKTGDQGYTMLQIKGKAWELYGQDAMLELVRRLWEQVSEVARLDVAFDGVAISPRELFDAYENGETRWGSVEYLNNKRGQVVWIGKLSRGSQQLSIYDERGWNRLEYRTRKRRIARTLLAGLVHGGADHFTSLTKSAIRGFVGGSWDKLDSWIGAGAVMTDIGGKGVKNAGKANDSWFKQYKKQVVIYVLRRGVDELERQLILAAKDIDAKTLDKYEIDWRTVGSKIGRYGPEGFEKGEMSMDDLRGFIGR